MAALNSFLGTGWKFPPSFNADSGTVELVRNEEDINESLRILLSTSIGERVMQPKYGCNLEDYLFEPMNANVIGIIKDLVATAILYFEPRIIAEKIDVTTFGSTDLIEGKFTITVQYTVPQTNSRFNFVYNYFSNEALTSISYL